MRTHDNIYLRLIVISLACGVYSFMVITSLSAQSLVFNTRIYLDERSTRLRNVLYYNDSLLVTGDIGTDILGLAGIFAIRLDTLGNLGNAIYYRDPSLDDHMLLDGRDPVIINEAGNIILAGVFLARDDLYIMELDQSLDTILYREYPSDYLTMYAQDITELYESYYVTGIVQTQNYDLDVFIQKIDLAGNIVWERSYGVSSRHEGGFAAIIEDGGLTVMISEEYDPTPTIKNDTRYWIRFMHIDTSGAILRDWREEVTGYEGWSGTLLKYGDDYIYTTNTIGEETNFGPLTGGQIVRRDKDFNVVWRKQYGAPDSQFTGLGDMILSADGELIVTGQNVDSGMMFNAARVMKINLMGDVLCEVRDTGISLPDGQSLNVMEGITESETGSLYAVGYTYRSAGFYEGLLLKVNPDGCIDTLCTTTAIRDLIRLQEERMIIYPNPVSDEMTIQVREGMPTDAHIIAYDAHGREMLREKISGIKYSIHTSRWPPGLYVIRLTAGGKDVAVKNVVKK